jgi:DNA-binding SARP family transcriptional activator
VTLKVRLLGRPRIEDADGRPGQPARGQKSWALLARVALADRPVTRAELAAELFAEADDPLGALRWYLADLRRCCQDPGLFRGDPIQVGDDGPWLDVRALGEGALPAAEIGGILLDGVELRDSPAFGLWLMLARGRCAARSAEELRRAALTLLGIGDAEAAIEPAGRAATMDPLNEGAQELLLRTLVAAGHPARAAVALAGCEALFAHEGLTPSPALRAATRAPAATPPVGLRARVIATSLLRAGKAALDAGSADAGVETLRQAAREAERARDPRVQAEVLAALGAALVHAVRGLDGEGAVVLNQALPVARAAGDPGLAADILREMAFVDVQAGRHTSATRALSEAAGQAKATGDLALIARIQAAQGMNEADQGRHDEAVRLLDRSIQASATAGRPRQQAWSSGIMARSLLLAGQPEQAREAAERSLALCERERWPAFAPWPQALRAHCLEAAGRTGEARDDAEQAFALACQLGDPCWEGMAGRALAMLALSRGDDDAAVRWIVDAQRRCDRLPDRYAWVSAFVSLGHVEIAARHQPDLVVPLALRLYQAGLRADLPEFIAWALVHLAEAGDPRRLPLAHSVAAQVVSPALHARLAALAD